jgi:deoxyribonuclease V
MFAATDVHYLPTGTARAALVLASDAAFSSIVAEETVLVPEVAPYEPGEFFRRELPPLRAVLAAALPDVELLIVDGYVDLDPSGRPGLGAHANQEFGVPVIGVAKTRFATATHAISVIRGESAKPLFVTSAGFPLPDAAALVQAMSGRYRLPDALRRADQLARGAAAAPLSRLGRPGRRDRRQGHTVTITSVSKSGDKQIQLAANGSVVGWQRRIQGHVFGMCNQGYQDLDDGKLIRGVIVHAS